MIDPVAIKPPTTHDDMTYCGTNWVSAWGWDLVSPWIEELSSWELGADVGPARPLLVGTVQPDGRSRFYVTQGWFDETLVRPSHAVRFYAGGALSSEALAQWVPWERSDAVNVIVPLADIDALSWHAPDRSGTIDRASLRVVGSLAAAR